MRTVERQSRAFQGLLKLAESQPLIIYFRGVNAADKPIYEITTKASAPTVVAQGTERELSKALETK